MKTIDFNYDLPQKFIAQTPVEPRDHSRLLVINRSINKISHQAFYNLDELLSPGDLLVLNQTRVIPARIFAKKSSGGKAELLLLRRERETVWQALVGGKGLDLGKMLQVDDGPKCEIIEVMDGSRRLIRFENPIEPFFPKIGHIPLPPYIRKTLRDPERYQTVFAQEPGSAAAPTAGLHFTQELFNKLMDRDIQITEVTLHVGLDTFAPVTEDDPADHLIHKEWCEVSQEACQKINAVRKNSGRIIAVGTTSVRTLESAAENSKVTGRNSPLTPYSGNTGLFILPGYEFKLVDVMITNFHLPKSTLIMLVSAFAGKEAIFNAYEIAKKENYRFFSFGDAMLIL
ncbi:MAG: tRNA preQ1(34) S-adenosylmethionine ribosyltransferase-isomerase QueA [Chloroflexi bacterium GWB2_49_20]|nr:MAG: tRNA preQ1(34) S-adenosylmethionine ribosyltransferase-isomerase QueA [Chloroflexi bacterium GWB2_49_20]OGN78125.1 MAG: tRNA preQ1(34) S-adenosylmethionine ribosyltransferase-isomerase QueA [Chloroflexi bacterium GWC2_49_37]OGN85162.1 MAG: tRNA preQ1(34) S-adenosylmethionine ribosyltransferase-isomerase QueA [Chloroflexi bacterium GWD2_49_16]